MATRAISTTARALLLVALLTAILGVPASTAKAQTSTPAELVQISGGYIAVGHLNLGARIEATGNNQADPLDVHYNELGSGVFCVANASYWEPNGALTFPYVKNGKLITSGEKSVTAFNTRAIYMQDDRVWVSSDIDANFSGDMVVGLVPDETNSDARGTTLVGVNGSDVYVVVAKVTVAQAVSELIARGVTRENVVMLDGGGSSQLRCQSGTLIASERLIPQGIGITIPTTSVQPASTEPPLYCYYAHTDQNPEWIQPGVRVKQGDIIGYAGDTGYGTGPHLHFGCSPYPPDVLETILNGSEWPWVDPDWELHPGWIAPVENPVQTNVDYYEYNAAGAQAHHSGNDYRGGYGTPLRAVADGEIVWVRWWPTFSESSVWYRSGERRVGTGHGITIVLKIDGQPTIDSAQEVEIAVNEPQVAITTDTSASVNFDFRTVTFEVGGKNYTVILWVTGFGLLGLVVVVLVLLVTVKEKRRGVRFIVNVIPEFLIVMTVIVVVGPPPYEVRLPPVIGGTTTTIQETQEIVTEVVTEVTSEEAILAWGDQHGIGRDNLLANIAASAVCWSDANPGKIVDEGSPELCTKVDLLTLLAIDTVETTDADLGWYDPTQPGRMGYQHVESSAQTRWGSDAMSQLIPIWDILMQPGMRERYPTAITDVNGNGVYEPSLGDHINVYGSSATCIGRSQGLPSSIEIFAWDMVEDPNFTFDPWNDEVSSAMFKAAHLAHSYTGETLLDKRRNAVMRYNPGAADLEWAIASGRIAELGDIPTATPTVTTTIVKTVVTVPVTTSQTNQELFHVLYSTWTEHTPLEYMIAFARVERGRKDITSEQQRFWEGFESTACNISWGFAARPCWQEVNQ